MMDLVRFVARDPGGANVLAAFLVRAGGGLPCDMWTLSRATRVFQQAGFKPREFPDDFSPHALAQAWANEPAGVLVTGTSHYEAFEPELWSLAREHGTQSLAVMDSWINLEPRFERGMPDFVGAVDAGQKNDLIALGFGADRVLVTGHPWLAQVWCSRSQLLDSAWAPDGQLAGAVNVLFVSESVLSDVSRKVNAPFGFDEFDAFGVLHEAALRSGLPVNLAIKFHPYEKPAHFCERLKSLSKSPRVRVLPLPAETRPTSCVIWADLVAGISSMLLLEAIMLGRPVASVQPGLIREETFIASRRGFTDTLVRTDTGVSRLVELMKCPQQRARQVARQEGFCTSICERSGQELLVWIQERLSACLPGSAPVQGAI